MVCYTAIVGLLPTTAEADGKPGRSTLRAQAYALPTLAKLKVLENP
jgi:hypothetical protein